MKTILIKFITWFILLNCFSVCHAVSTFTYTSDVDFQNFILDGLEIDGTGEPAKLEVRNKWVNINPASTPQARHSAGLAFDPFFSKSLLFGGREDTTALSDTWIFRLSDEQWEFQNLTQKPGARCAHRVAGIGSGKFLLFGGLDDTAKYFNETWIYDLSSNTWTRKNFAVNPSSRAYSSMCFIPSRNKVYMFGGVYGASVLNDLWVYDVAGDSWSYVVVGSSPAPRFSHGMAYSRTWDCIVIYGGRTDYGNTRLGDLWAFNPGANTFQKITPGGYAPAGISDFVFEYMPNIDRFCLYSGNNGTISGETWMYDLSGNRWSQGNYSVYPPIREKPASFVSNTGNMYIFGGTAASAFNDTWKYLVRSSGTFVFTASVVTHIPVVWDKLNLNCTIPPSSAIKCQIAYSNDGVNWNPYRGPNGAVNTYYTGSGSFNIWDGDRDKAYISVSGYMESQTAPVMPELPEIQVVYNTRPYAPGLIQPQKDEVINSLNPAFAWYKSGDYDGDLSHTYRLQVSTSPSFTSNVVDKDLIQETTGQTVNYITSVGLRTGKYYWRVYGQDISTGPWSETYNFSVDTTQPSGISGITAVTGNRNGKIELIWKSPGDDGTAGQIAGGQYIIRFTSRALIVSEQDWQDAEGERADTLTASPGDTVYSAVEGLKDATTYYLAMKVCDSAGNISTLSINNPSAFTNAMPSVLLFEPNGNDTLVKRHNVGWSYCDPNPGDTALMSIKVSSDPAGNNYDILVVSGLPNGTTFYNWDSRQVANGATYKIKVVVTDWRGLSGEDTSREIFTVENSNEEPQLALLYPGGGEVLHDTETLRWDLLDYNRTDIHDILLFISSDNGVNFSSVARLTGSSASYTLNTLPYPNGADYIFKIHIIEVNTIEKYEKEAVSGRFNIINNNLPPNRFNLVYPADNAGVSTVKLKLKWENMGDPNPEDTVSYTLYFSTMPGFNPETILPGISGSEYILSPPAIMEGQRYYWKVRATDMTGKSILSDNTFSFYTLDRYRAVSEDGIVSAEVVSGMPADAFLSIEAISTGSSPELMDARRYAVKGRLIKLVSGKAYDLAIKDMNQASIEDDNIICEVKVRYSDNNNDGYDDNYLIPVDNLKVAYLDRETNGWIFDRFKQQTDKSAKLIIASLGKLSFITMAGSNVPDRLLSGINLFPNPFSPNTGLLHVLYVLNDNADIEVSIYTLIGGLVKKWKFGPGITGKSLGQVEGYSDEIVWDGRNGAGDMVSNGMYLCVIEAGSASGKQREMRYIGVVK